MDKARIYVDFNEMIDHDIVMLSQNDTKVDSEGNVITFYEGKNIEIYTDDVDPETDQIDNLIASGHAILNNGNNWKHVKWFCRIDSKGIRHESDLCEDNSK
nr:hypothetical protein [uncultured Flavobacterium sp.]